MCIKCRFVWGPEGDGGRSGKVKVGPKRRRRRRRRGLLWEFDERAAAAAAPTSTPLPTKQ